MQRQSGAGFLMTHVLAACNAKHSSVVAKLKVTRQRFGTEPAQPGQSTTGAMLAANTDSKLRKTLI